MMGSVTLFDRCIVIKLTRDHHNQNRRFQRVSTKNISRKTTGKCHQELQNLRSFLHFQYGSLPKRKSCYQTGFSRSFKKDPNSKTSSSTPNSPTNSPLVSSHGAPVVKDRAIDDSVTTALQLSSRGSTIDFRNEKKEPSTISCVNHFDWMNTSHQLYEQWVTRNSKCIWDPDLVEAVEGTHFIGALKGELLLVGGTPRNLSIITLAHSRGLLFPPPGWDIVTLGELQECIAKPIPKSQFTPLSDAICSIVHRLNTDGKPVTLTEILDNFPIYFPSTSPPSISLVHSALSDLIRTRKVFHSGSGYGIVRTDTYAMSSSFDIDMTVDVIARTSHRNAKDRWLSTGLAPVDTLSSNQVAMKCHSVKHVGKIREVGTQTVPSKDLNGDCLIDSLKDGSPRKHKAVYGIYKGFDLSDITVKCKEKASLFTKLMQISQSRFHLGSFNAQFPPPEWISSGAKIKHLHSVATQTKQRRKKKCSEESETRCSKQISKSSTLPRKSILPSSMEVPKKPRCHSATSSPRKKLSRQTTSNDRSNSSKLKPHYNMEPSAIIEMPRPEMVQNGNVNSSSLRDHFNRTASRRRHHSSSPRRRNEKNLLERSYYNNTKFPSATLLSKNDRPPLGNLGLTNISQKSRIGKKVIFSTSDDHTEVLGEKSSMTEAPDIKEIAEKDFTDKCNIYENLKPIHSNSSPTRSTQLSDFSSKSDMNNVKVMLDSPESVDNHKHISFQKNFATIREPVNLMTKNDIYEAKNKCDKQLYTYKRKTYEYFDESLANQTADGDNDLTEVSGKGEEEKSALFLPLMLSKFKSPLAEESCSNSINLQVAYDVNSKVKNVENPSSETKVCALNKRPGNFDESFKFSSLTAKKITQGLSTSSIDTIIEVNMIAEKIKQHKEHSMKKDFGVI